MPAIFSVKLQTYTKAPETYRYTQIIADIEHQQSHELLLIPTFPLVVCDGIRILISTSPLNHSRMWMGGTFAVRFTVGRRTPKINWMISLDSLALESTTHRKQVDMDAFG